MMMNRTTSRAQHGQAMVEALIASALVLVPLFLAIPVIAKYMDIKCYTVQAARYAAWERSVWFGGDAAAKMGIGNGGNKWKANAKSDDQIRQEIDSRLLYDSTSPFQSGSATTGNEKTFWHDRKGTSLLQNYDGNSNKVDNSTSPGLTSVLLSPLLTITSVVSNFTLDTKAEYTADVGLTVKQVAYNTGAGLGGCKGSSDCQGVDYLATGTPMSFSEKDVLVANGWSANGPGSLNDKSGRLTVYSQIRGLTPSSLLNPPNGAFRDVLNVLKTLSTVLFPELSTLELGKIEVDKMPADRLK